MTEFFVKTSPDLSWPLTRRRSIAIATSAVITVVSVIGALCIGPQKLMGLSTLLDVLLHPSDDLASVFVWDLRMPRAILGIVCGMNLAVAGVLMQALVQNELAVPELTGVTGGAAFAVVTGIVWLHVQSEWLPILGIVGGFSAAALTVFIAWNGTLRPLRLTLAGIAVTSLMVAGTKTTLVLAESNVDTLFFWMVGGLASRSWSDVAVVLPWSVVGVILAFLSNRSLDLFQLGENQARSLGVPVTTWRALVLASSVMLTAGTVAVAGPIAFLGIAVPHAARSISGHSHFWLLIVSACLGAALLTSADFLTRFVGGTRELPVGMLIACVGGPVLIQLVVRERR